MNNKSRQNVANQVKTVIIILTHDCNLNCVYCYEHNKNEKEISLERAKLIIKEEMEANDDISREFEFFGGEPLLKFDLIVELHNFLCSQKWTKKWLATITTNGVLVHGKIKDWLNKNQDTVKVALSADGTPRMHNKNRCNSYGLIDFDFFASTNSVVKMTISVDTLPFLSEGIIHLHQLGFKVVRANLAFGIYWSDENNLTVFAEELHKLADYYIDNPQIRPSDILDLQISEINPERRKHISRYCGAGIGLVAYETDGTAYPCHTFAPVSVDDEIARKARDLSFENEISIEMLDKKCRDCCVENVCPNCYGINFSSTGNMYSKDDAYCRMLKVQFLVNAYFKYKQYISGQLSLTREEEYRLLNNIKMVQELEV